MAMRTLSLQQAAGDTHPGRLRDVNEDRFHIDSARGLYIVIDGVGGQAAGGKAADVGMTMMRKRLERETGPVAERIREAITVANNEILRVAALRPEWHGMACVLTVALVEDDRAIVGHVGDTRLYKLRHDRIDKITRDHSPVGEREDANELSESEAMRHPRRNEVYRDVGSEPHEPGDLDFIDVHEIPFEPDAALVVCSDGLSDLVPAGSIADIARQYAGDPGAVAHALVEAANDAGGKDNVTVVYVEGEQFAARAASVRQASGGSRPSRDRPARSTGLLATALVVVAFGAGFLLGWTARLQPFIAGPFQANVPAAAEEHVVKPSESIMAAIVRATPGSIVIVEPGEYREQLVLRDHIRLVSRVARAATLRLPTDASESEAAIVATDLTRAEISGFRIVGDAATPLGTGILVRNAGLAVVDVEIAGATEAAIDIAGERETAVLASEIHENPGAALAVRAGASPRISQNTFVRNGAAEPGARSFVIEEGAHPRLSRNFFHGISVDLFSGLDQAERQMLTHNNWFPAMPKPTPTRRSGRP